MGKCGYNPTYRVCYSTYTALPYVWCDISTYGKRDDIFPNLKNGEKNTHGHFDHFDFPHILTPKSSTYPTTAQQNLSSIDSKGTAPLPEEQLVQTNCFLLLMVHKSGIHQLRLVVYPTIFYFTGLKIHQRVHRKSREGPLAKSEQKSLKIPIIQVTSLETLRRRYPENCEFLRSYLCQTIHVCMV